MRQINYQPNNNIRFLLALLPFILLVAAYLIGSEIRLEDNPQDKLLPSLTQMFNQINKMAFMPDKRSGDYLFWLDTYISLGRLLGGLFIASIIGLCFGIVAGVFPMWRASLSPLMIVLSMIPPLAILPILFIIFGLGELSKIMLIVIGVTPILARDLENQALATHKEILIKAQTLGANSWTLILRIFLPQLLSRLLISLRLLLGSAWLFLISAEAISATAGLGYRIFLVRRYMSMDIIIPYVIWITLIAWLMDIGLKQLHKASFPWANGGRK